MKHRVTVALALLALATGLFVIVQKGLQKERGDGSSKTDETDHRALPRVRSTSSPKAPAKAKKVRDEYFFRLLRDPATNTIPPDVRQRELAYARTLPRFGEGFFKSSTRAEFVWSEAGPTDVGGRTRALAIDVTNSHVIIAGGVSGGIWKSTDGGDTWTLKGDPADPTQQLSVTSIAQETRPGHTNTWYSASGEILGSGGDRGRSASLFGSGLYKSTDNGETWTQIKSGLNPTRFDSFYDFVSRVVVSPTTGSLFITTNAVGVRRSTDGGQNFATVLGEVNEHGWADLAVGPDGTLVATLSDPFTEDTEPQTSAGVYVSTDDGDTWTDITPDTYPEEQDRSVVAIAPSNPDVAYVMVYTGATKTVDEEEVDDVRFHRFNLATGEAEDRSENLPDFGGEAGQLDMQFGYNMALAVKPDDENFVLIGGTNLFRSRNGFATKADQLTENWIGGYGTDNNLAQYENHHADQHALVFDPANPDKLWSAHDGGLSVVDDITKNVPLVPWRDRNDGYNVTQFYAVAIPDEKGDNRIMGGTQDNGTPFFRPGEPSEDVSSGDGAYAYFGDEYAYTSSQNGRVIRRTYRPDGVPGNPYSIIKPIGARNQLFIHPFAVDPNDEDVMYYPAGDVLWRNNALSSIPDFEDSTLVGWAKLDSIAVPDGYLISTLAVTRTPAHRLYLGASSRDDEPRLYRLDEADTAEDGLIDISINLSQVPEGAYVHSIAVNPADGDEMLVAFSNYNVVGLYHSTDGGVTYTAVEGNLEGSNDEPGPSIRSATILPLGDETVYVVGTSTGVYSTQLLHGASTEWELESADQIGHAVVEYVTSRANDGRVAAATHGRGIFLGDSPNFVSVEEAPGEQPGQYALAQNYPNPFNPTTQIAFTLPQASSVTLSLYDVTGRKVRDLIAGEQRAAGRHTFDVDAADLASGTYLYRLEAHARGDVFIDSRQMTLVK